MRRMLSPQLNLVYNQLNLPEIKCEAKKNKNKTKKTKQITCRSFTGKSMNGRISRRRKRTKTELKTTWNKDSSNYYSRIFQIGKG